MNKMRFSVLPVGQGTGTLVQVLNSSGKPIETVLLDLGSKGWKRQETGLKSANFVEQQLRTMDNPTLEAVFLSHGDEDHINLIIDVLKKFKKPSEGGTAKETLTVSKVWYGGKPRAYVKGTGKRQVDVLRELEGWRPISAGSILTPAHSDLSSPTHVSPAGVKYYVISANILGGAVANALKAEGPTRTKDTGYLNNMISLVVGVVYGSSAQWIIVTGDATGLTMADCNNQIATKPGVVPNQVLSLTAPHHGSVRTTYNLIGVRTEAEAEKDLSRKVVNKFVQNLTPTTLSVSSGEVKSFKLPRVSVLSDLGKYLPEKAYIEHSLALKGLEQHFVTAYFSWNQLQVTTPSEGSPARWPSANGWRTVRTSKNLFSTDYFNGRDPEVPAVTWQSSDPSPKVQIDAASNDAYSPSPPWGTGWVWEVEEDGTAVPVQKVLELDALSSEYREHLEDVHGLAKDLFIFVPSAPESVGAEEEEEAPHPARVAVMSTASGAPDPDWTGRRALRVIP
jgi:hypothetical protein